MGACKPLVGNQSAVVVLLDYSKTFAPYDDADVAALKQVSGAVAQSLRVGSLKQPTKILWAAFGDDGRSPIRPCGPPVVFRQSLTKRKDAASDDTEYTKITDLTAWMDACFASIKATSHWAQQFTDVTGALAFAGDAVKDAAGTKLVIVYSDLLEDLHKDRKSGEFRIDGAKLALIWRPGRDDKRQPSEVEGRVAEWRQKLRQAGAGKVCSSQVQSITAGDLLTCLFN
jgi:hypothetical protein